MLLAVGSAQGADAITFVRMVRDQGLGAEANPFVAYLASLGDLAPLVLLKAALVLFVVAVFAVVARRHPAAGSLVATVAVVAGIVGAYSNVAVIVGSAGRLLPL
jgi:Domain of unknown function (DUF5658)